MTPAIIYHRQQRPGVVDTGELLITDVNDTGSRHKVARGGGGVELTSERVREAIVNKARRKYQHDRLNLQSINSNKNQ